MSKPLAAASDVDQKLDHSGKGTSMVGIEAVQNLRDACIPTSRCIPKTIAKKHGLILNFDKRASRIDSKEVTRTKATRRKTRFQKWFPYNRIADKLNFDYPLKPARGRV